MRVFLTGHQARDLTIPVGDVVSIDIEYDDAGILDTLSINGGEVEDTERSSKQRRKYGIHVPSQWHLVRDPPKHLDKPGQKG